MKEDTVLFSYAKALAESVISVTLPPGTLSVTEMDQFVVQLAAEILEGYRQDGLPYGETEEGLAKYLLNTKIKIKGNIL